MQLTLTWFASSDDDLHGFTFENDSPSLQGPSLGFLFNREGFLFSIHVYGRVEYRQEHPWISSSSPPAAYKLQSFPWEHVDTLASGLSHLEAFVFRLSSVEVEAATMDLVGDRMPHLRASGQLKFEFWNASNESWETEGRAEDGT